MTRATATPTARDAYVDAAGLRFHYRAWGDPRAPAALLLHGLTGNAWEWDPVAAALSRRFRVVAVDQRGHGASAWAPAYAPELMVEDLAAIAAALDLRPSAVVGHSMGALNAFLLAARRPDLVDRLAIVDFGPQSLTPGMAAEWRAHLRAAARARYADAAEAVAEWRAANPRAREPELAHFIAHNLVRRRDGRWGWRFDAARLHDFFERAPGEELQWAALRDVDCPTLVLRGERSDVLAADTAARMVHELARGRMVEIPGGAHDLTVEQPGALTAAVDAFLT